VRTQEEEKGGGAAKNLGKSRQIQAGSTKKGAPLGVNVQGALHESRGEAQTQKGGRKKGRELGVKQKGQKEM